MLIDEINVAKLFHVKSPSLVRYKEGDLLLLTFSNLTCMEEGYKTKEEHLILTSFQGMTYTGTGVRYYQIREMKTELNFLIDRVSSQCFSSYVSVFSQIICSILLHL